MKVTIFNNVSKKYLTEQIPDFQEVSFQDEPEVIFVRSEKLKDQPLPKSLIAICRPGAGVDNIPIDWCNKNGVVIFNAPGANANAVKELVIWALISASRKVLPAIQFLNENSALNNTEIEKLKGNYQGSEIANKRIYIIGLGTIGSLVAKTCRALEMTVYAYDPYAPKEKFNDLIKINSLEDVPACDFISIHSVLTPETAKLVNENFLNKVKPGVKLLNFARAELIDQEALYAAMRKDLVSIYASDFPDAKLKTLFPDRAIFLPHLGASTLEAEEGALSMVTRQLINFWNEGQIENSVNFPSCRLEMNDYFRLIVSNFNVPGMISEITKLLGESGYNVTAMVNKSRGEVGYNIIDIDNPSSDMSSVIGQIMNIQGVTKVRYLKKP